MINKKLRMAITGLFVLLAIGIYLLFANWDYLVLGPYSGQLIDSDRIELVNWQQDGDTCIAQEDPQIIFHGINGYVDYLVMHMGTAGAELDPKVYYTTAAGMDYTEERSMLPEYEYEDNLLKIYVDKEVANLRLDPVEEGELRILLVSATTYPIAFQWDPIDLLICLFAVGVLLVPLYYPMSAWGRAGAYTAGFKKYSYLLQNLVKKDITTKYRRSVLGIVWSVLNPLMMMLVITAVFQRLFRFQVENFPLYYLTGSLIFNFVSEATSSSMISVISAGPLIRKVYVPKYIFPVEKCLFATVNMLLSMIAVGIMYLVLQFQPPWTILLFPVPMIYTFVFCVGFGMILASLNVFFRDIGHLYSVWITAWMYLTPIIYPMDILPGPMLTIVRMNPLFYFVDYFRQVAMYGTVPGIRFNLICCMFSFGFLIAGLLIFKKKQDQFILYI